jgi:flagellar hook-associated protein 1
VTISSTLANALSGLNAAGRAASVLSSNVANAMTPGYARRELNLSAETLGGDGAGVRIGGVTRSVNQSVLNDRRLADSDVANADARRAFLERIEKAVGDPGDPASLSGRFSGFETALVTAASRPDSTQRLQAVAYAGHALAGKINDLGDMVQAARTEADARIAGEVGTLNRSLADIAGLNAQITAFRSQGGDATALMDQRQLLADKVAAIVPIREVARGGEQIALFTTGGAVLLDGRPATVGFKPASVITADMTLASGALSGLTLNGMAVQPTDTGLMGGGSLGAQFALRDDLAPAAQAQLDGLARDLITRFEPPGPDATLSAGQPGLFTDNGAAFDPLDETGLAGRLSLSALADPAQGGALWRLRDGLGAAAPGSVGDATLLQRLADALAQARIPASGAFAGAARSAPGLAADLLSRLSGARLAADDRSAASSARQAALSDLQAEDGVDADAEMQTLLLVEQAYSANAKVIKTMDDLIRQLIGW